MTFAAFALTFGGLLALMGVIAAWLFRSTAAPLWEKLAISALVVGLGTYAPFTVAQMMGFPLPVTMTGLPDKADLIAFVPHDEGGMVSLWLIAPPATEPRAYEAKLTGSLKDALREAQVAMGRGQAAVLRKTKGGAHGKSAAGNALGIGDDEMTYELDPNAMTALPRKE